MPKKKLSELPDKRREEVRPDGGRNAEIPLSEVRPDVRLEVFRQSRTA
jgi:hypothetical protein